MTNSSTRRLGRRGRLAAALGGILTVGVIAVAPVGLAHADPGHPDSDAMCYTTTAVAKPFYDGPSASRVYDQNFGLAVALPKGLLDGRYDPQGLATWSNWDGKGEDVLLVSAYEDTNGNQAPDGPSAIYGVVVSGGARHGKALGRMLISQGHVGGLAVYNGWLYVGTEKTIRGYRLSTVRSVLAGANSSKVYGASYTYNASYTVGFMGNGDGHVWAGDFDASKATHLNGYRQTSASTGALKYDASTQSYAPKKTQGVLVTGSRVIFSTSYGRGDRGNLWVMPRNQHSLTDTNSYCFRAPSMNEGIATINGRLYVGFEGGAYTYNHDPKNLPRNRVSWVHSAALSTVLGMYSSTASAD